MGTSNSESGSTSDARIVEAPTRKVSLWNTVNLFLGIMIGSGIFVSAKDLAANLPNSGSVISMWLFIGFFSLLGSLCFAELGTCFPDSGGDFLYLKKLSGKKMSDLVAFMRIFIELVVIRPGTHAIFGLTIGKYLIIPFITPKAPAQEYEFQCQALSGLPYENETITEAPPLDYIYNCTEEGRHEGLRNCKTHKIIADNAKIEGCDAESWLEPNYRCDEGDKEVEVEETMALKLAQIFCAVFLNLLFTYVNAYEVKLTQQLSSILSMGKIVILSIMVLLGGYTIVFKEKSRALTWGSGPEEMWDWSRWENLGASCIASAIVKASYAGQWAYAGWSDINYCMGEISNPSKNYPRAAMITLPLVTFLYTGIIICFYSVMTHTDFLCGITATASVFAERALGFESKNNIIRIIIGLSVSMATAGVLHSSIFSAARLFAAGVKFNHMPKVIGGHHKKYGTPVPSIFLLCLISLIYCFTPLVSDDAINKLVNATCFIYFLAIALCILLLVCWRLKGRPNAGSVLDKHYLSTDGNPIDCDEESPLSEGAACIGGATFSQQKSLDEVFTLPIWLHLSYALVSLAISAYNIYAEWGSTLLGLSMMLVAVPVYYIFIYDEGPLLEMLGCESLDAAERKRSADE